MMQTGKNNGAFIHTIERYILWSDRQWGVEMYGLAWGNRLGF